MNRSIEDVTPQTNGVVNRNYFNPEVDLGVPQMPLENRLLSMQNGLNQIKIENSILKMKSTITLGNMRLQLESLQEDNNFLCEKCVYLKKKFKVSQQSLRLKEAELATLLSMVPNTREV